MQMPDSNAGSRQNSQSRGPIHFAAKFTFLAAFEPRQLDAEMQHGRPTNVARRQHIFRQKVPPRFRAELNSSTVHPPAPAQTPPSVHTAFMASLSPCSLPEQWDAHFAIILRQIIWRCKTGGYNSGRTRRASLLSSKT
jgi:hypothetical protein